MAETAIEVVPRGDPGLRERAQLLSCDVGEVAETTVMVKLGFEILQGDLGVELDAPGNISDPVGLQTVGAVCQRRPFGRELQLIPVPLQRVELGVSRHRCGHGETLIPGLSRAFRD